MDQIYRRFSTDHVRNLLRGYTEGLLERPAIEETPGINKSRFFALLRAYRNDPEAFTIAYQRPTPRKLPAAWEEEIKRALLEEKALIENQDLPISSYNYSAIRDRLQKKGIRVCVPTIISRAKALGCLLEFGGLALRLVNQGQAEYCPLPPGTG